MANLASEPEHSHVSMRSAYGIVWLLTGINLINYVDRYVLAAVGSQVIADLHLTQEQFGWIGSALIISYTFLTPIFGWLGDRYSRTKLMAAGVGIWSLATGLGGFATDYVHMLAARSLIGVGEASYASVAPSLIADYFPPKHRATPIGLFNAAIPAGTAGGLILGGILGTLLGWRYAFFLVGFPGIVLAISAYLIREPVRGALDSETDRALAAARKGATFVQNYLTLLRNPLYLLSVLGYSAVTFSLGALAYWAPQLLQTDKGMSETSAGITIGLCAGVGGTLGTLVGGTLSDRLLKRTPHAYPYVCAATAALSVVPMVVAISASTPAIYLTATMVTIVIAFMGNAPVNAIIVNSVPADLRVSAVALSILSIHVLGDAISQPVVGRLSDTVKAGGTEGIGAMVARMFMLDPSTHHLSVAMLLLPVAMVVGAAFFLAAIKVERRHA